MTAGPGSSGSTPRLVTLTTDIGWAYAAQMKGVLHTLCPGIRVVDLTHEIPPQAVEEAAFLLEHMASRYPAGVVHVAVVDPGVGSERQPLLIETPGGGALLGPDNGVLWPLSDRLGRVGVYRLDRSKVSPEGPASATFDGRDLFAPAAAHVARGVEPRRLGSPTEARTLSLVDETLLPDGGAEGRVLHVDVFGNVITSLGPRGLPKGLKARLERPGTPQSPALPLRVVRTYAELSLGEFGLLLSSFDRLELSLRNGHAARALGLKAGDRVRVVPGDR